MVLLAGHWRNSLTVCLCLPGVAVCIIGLLWGRSHHFYRQQVMGGYSARHLEKYLISHFKPLNPRRVSTGTMRNNIIIAIDLVLEIDMTLLNFSCPQLHDPKPHYLGVLENARVKNMNPWQSHPVALLRKPSSDKQISYQMSNKAIIVITLLPWLC